MSKTPFLGPVMAAMLLTGATISLAAPTTGAGAIARAHHKAAAVGVNAWDGRPLGPEGITAVGEADLGVGSGTTGWDSAAMAVERNAADGVRPTGEFGGASKLANLSPDAEAGALPLSQFEGNHAKPSPGHDALGVWDFVNRVRYGRLPEPASWALMLIGFGMIGAALRGFVVANRRLARLQPEEGDEVER